MIRARARAKMHMPVHYLLIVCTSYMLDRYPTIFGVVTLYVDILSLTLHVNPQALICF